MLLNNTEHDVLWNFLIQFKRAEDHCWSYHQRARTFYKNYRMFRTKTDFPYANSVFTPDTFAFVEDATAKIVQTITSHSPIFSVQPRYGGNVDVARQLERVLQYCIENEDFEFFPEFLDLVKNGGIFGTSFMMVLPEFSEKPEGVGYEGPNYEFVDYWDIFPDPGARRLTRKARWIFKRTLLYNEELEELGAKGVYQNINEALQLGTGGFVDHERRRLLQEIGLESYEPDEPGRHEVLEQFIDGHIVSVINRQMIIRDTRTKKLKPFPYDMPMVDYRYISVPGEFNGIGIPEILQYLQADKNVVRSQRRENVDLVLNKILKIRRGADVDVDLLKYFPGAVWETEDPSRDIIEHDMRDVTQSAYLEEEKISLDMESATGMYKYSRGQDPSRTETATAIVRLQQAALARHDITIKLAEFTTLRNLAQKVILQIRAFMPQQTYELIIGEPDKGFYQMSLNDIARNYRFLPVGSSVTAIKEVRQNQILQAQQMLMSVPPAVQQQNIHPFTIDYKRVLEIGLEDALQIPNVGELVIPLPPPPPPPMIPGMMGQGGQMPPEQLLAGALQGQAPGGLLPPELLMPQKPQM
jgi:hypothetical protein